MQSQPFFDLVAQEMDRRLHEKIERFIPTDDSDFLNDQLLHDLAHGKRALVGVTSRSERHRISYSNISNVSQCPRTGDLVEFEGEMRVVRYTQLVTKTPPEDGYSEIAIGCVVD